VLRQPLDCADSGGGGPGLTAVWTAVHYKIPFQFVFADERPLHDDGLHPGCTTAMTATMARAGN
jgi:hypothetical protein